MTMMQEEALESVTLSFQNQYSNDDGIMKSSELKSVLQGLNQEMWSDASVDALLAGAGTQRDGAIQFAEFLSWVFAAGNGQECELPEPALRTMSKPLLRSMSKAIYRGLSKSSPETTRRMSKRLNDAGQDMEELQQQMNETQGVQCEEEIQMAFKFFDQFGEGVITHAGLKQAMSEMGNDFTDEEVAEMISAWDVDGQGRVSYEAFKQMMLADSNAGD